jgi:single-strand DNA-binding protein
MNYINKIMLVGRCGQEPELKYFESGAVKASISIAIRPPYKSEQVLWFDLVAWGKQAEVIGNYVRKSAISKWDILVSLLARGDTNRQKS